MELLYKNKKTLKELEHIVQEKRKRLQSLHVENNKGFFVYGDNFDGMISLLEEFENKVDLVYIDPPYNTKKHFFYNENRTSSISFSNTDILAYSDKMDFEEYLEFIRERLFLIHKLLSNQGTLYFHIDCKVGHYIKILLDEIFGSENFINDIARIKCSPKNFKRKAFGNQKDVIYVYSKKTKENIFNNILEPLTEADIKKYFKKLDEKGRLYTTVSCHGPGENKKDNKWNGIQPPKGRHWIYSVEKLEELDKQGLIEWSKNKVPRIKKYLDEHEGKKIQDIWIYKDKANPIYPTEKNNEMLDMIVKQSSNENSVIMDCFAGSSSFLKVGLENNRYVIGIDKSPISKKVFLEKRTELAELPLIEIN